MIKANYLIKDNIEIAEDTLKMCLVGDTTELKRHGQFVNISLHGFYLRRPLAVSDWDETSLTVIYKVVGNGTKAMSMLKSGDTLDVLVGLGNGYDISLSKGKKIVLVGGGAGVPPLIGLSRVLDEQSQDVKAVIGFNSKSLSFGYEELLRYVSEVRVATLDGSLGVKGTVADILKDMDYEYYYACGPEPMLCAVHSLKKEGQLSFEARMGCGFGACMGCSCRTLTGYKRICTDGPIMLSTEVSFSKFGLDE